MSAVLQAQEPSARYVDAVAPQLVRDFQVLAEAPGSVARLRQLILSMAVRGKLVPQQSSDEPASGLIGRLVAARAKRLGAGLSANALDTAGRDDGALPCELPSGWAWVRLTDLGAFCGGKTPSKQIERYWSGSIPWITPKDMKRLRLADSEDHVSQAAVDDGLELIPRNSLLIVVRSGILRRTVPSAVNEVETTINQDLKALKLTAPEMSAYVQLLVRGFEQFILNTLTKVGTTVESIRFDDFATQLFPLLPFAEQARILARVDELMQLCDALEAKCRLEAQQHARLLETLLGTLTDSTTPAELAANWERVAQHFDLLLDRPEAVDVLEQTVLQLAVRGLLVPQDLTDEPATKLMDRVVSEKNLLVASGKIKRDKPLPPVTDDVCPHAIPEKWKWVRLGSVVSISTGKLDANAATAGGKFPFFTCSSTPLSIDSYSFDCSAVLLAGNGDFNLKMYSGKFDAYQRTYVIEPCLIELRLLYFFLKQGIERISSGQRGTAVPYLRLGDITESMFALPPLAEQSRIVDQIEKLLRDCAALRQRLAASQATQSRLAAALVDQVA